MPLIDQNGNKLRLGRPPQYEVKIVASRREIVWSDGVESEDKTRRDIAEREVREVRPPAEIPLEIEVEPKKKEVKSYKNKKEKSNNFPKKPPVNKRNYPGKLLKSKSDDEISRRKISTSSFTLLSSTTSNNSTDGSGRKPRENVDTDINPAELDKAVRDDMAGVSSRSMDLMIMEMRKLDRDRDRVLIPSTVKTTLEKFHIPLRPGCQQLLLQRFEDHNDFKGMINYEELVRFLEERRLEGGRSSKRKVDSFILYESEHDKAGYKRNKSWTNTMEDRLVADIKKDLGSGTFSLSDLERNLHEKDSFGHNQVNSPSLRSVLRDLVNNISNKPVSGIMKASDLEKKGSHSIPVVLDIMKKVL